MNHHRLPACAALALIATLGLACDDPAEGKAKAEVGTATTATPAAAPKGKAFKLKTEGSTFEFVGSKITGSHSGGFKAFTGTATLAEGGKIEGAQVKVEVDTKSVFTDAEGLTKHLKNEDFFAVEKFPTATFESTKVATGGDKGASHTITGNLNLHGETKSISFPATIAKAGDGLTVKAEFVINRKDFGIVYKGKPDDLIKDDVVIKLDLKLGA